MASRAVDKDLDQRLEALAQDSDGRVRIADIKEVVHALMDTLRGDVTATELRAYRELEGLVHYIEQARQDIASLRPDEIQSDYIPKATDELDAIVSATEQATNDILDAAEQIETMAEEHPEMGDRLMEVTTRIYEASNFQDITGQRVNKVVNMLKHIEQKVGDLARTFGLELEEAAEPQGEAAEAPATAPDDERPDADLLNGPQQEGTAKNQAEIDALLASFD